MINAIKTFPLCSYIIPTTPSLVPLSFLSKSRRQAEEIAHRSSPSPPLFEEVSGEVRSPVTPKLHPSSFPSPDSRPEPFPIQFVQGTRAEQARPSSPALQPLRPRIHAASGTHPRRRHLHPLRRPALYPVSIFSSPGLTGAAASSTAGGQTPPSPPFSGRNVARYCPRTRAVRWSTYG